MKRPNSMNIHIILIDNSMLSHQRLSWILFLMIQYAGRTWLKITHDKSMVNCTPLKCDFYLNTQVVILTPSPLEFGMTTRKLGRVLMGGPGGVGTFTAPPAPPPTGLGECCCGYPLDAPPLRSIIPPRHREILKYGNSLLYQFQYKFF